MASLTVRSIPDDVKLRFRQLAAAHGRSMEEHLRQMLVLAVADMPVPALPAQITPAPMAKTPAQAAAAPPVHSAPAPGWAADLVRAADGAGDSGLTREEQPLRDSRR
jgi:plasmid stability protein